MKKLLLKSSQNKTPQQLKYGKSTLSVLTALKLYGSQSRAELEVSADIDKRHISAILSRLNKRTPRAGKQIHVVRYVYDAEGSRRYPRAVYALGDGIDAPKPKPNDLENRRRYDAKRKNRYTKNSVFNLAKTRDQIRAELRAIA